MISALKVLESRTDHPYTNIAVEKFLTETAGEGECILFLWQNRKTVVIGKNQNMRAECRAERLIRDGGFPARRLSGGGAVFHDLGNLNVSFVARKPDYDIARQTNVVLRAVKSLGIPAEVSGRNDLTAQGRKFSGHAYYEKGGCGCHHATLMMDVDTEELGLYLNVQSGKLASHGVASVRSRVVNLKDFRPDIGREMLSQAIRTAFAEEYGLPAEDFPEERLDREAIRRDAEWLGSDAWLYGRNLPFTASYETRFSWGNLAARFSVNEGIIRGADCYSDAMDERFPEMFAEALPGCVFQSLMVSEAVRKHFETDTPERRAMAAEAADWLRKELAE